ncbi:MAG: hypothetical protein M9891_06175 [Austwickia sp.]|nr:hypothetical protein [Actinomycetota bacterium]MCB1255389.1 hypothetical protein [Austwickia sp.]MCO5308866.1 hypothetical protein [Austwickia sp.]
MTEDTGAAPFDARVAAQAAQLDAADGDKVAPPSSAPGPDPMSRVIEEHAEASAAVDPQDLTDGREW